MGPIRLCFRMWFLSLHVFVIATPVLGPSHRIEPRVLNSTSVPQNSSVDQIPEPRAKLTRANFDLVVHAFKAENPGLATKRAAEAAARSKETQERHKHLRRRATPSPRELQGARTLVQKVLKDVEKSINSTRADPRRNRYANAANDTTGLPTQGRPPAAVNAAVAEAAAMLAEADIAALLQNGTLNLKKDYRLTGKFGRRLRLCMTLELYSRCRHARFERRHTHVYCGDLLPWTVRSENDPHGLDCTQFHSKEAASCPDAHLLVFVARRMPTGAEKYTERATMSPNHNEEQAEQLRLARELQKSYASSGTHRGENPKGKRGGRNAHENAPKIAQSNPTPSPVGNNEGGDEVAMSTTTAADAKLTQKSKAKKAMDFNKTARDPAKSKAIRDFFKNTDEDIVKGEVIYYQEESPIPYVGTKVNKQEEPKNLPATSQPTSQTLVTPVNDETNAETNTRKSFADEPPTLAADEVAIPCFGTIPKERMRLHEFFLSTMEAPGGDVIDHEHEPPRATAPQAQIHPVTAGTAASKSGAFNNGHKLGGVGEQPVRTQSSLPVARALGPNKARPNNKWLSNGESLGNKLVVSCVMCPCEKCTCECHGKEKAAQDQPGLVTSASKTLQAPTPGASEAGPKTPMPVPPREPLFIWNKAAETENQQWKEWVAKETRNFSWANTVPTEDARGTEDEGRLAW
ncbi:hypothetical protein QBC46DRAFT_405740 [Diplogelasinospora grovesii]|uniref:Uncharacterized protein n=1 Tax=Diplogelasinospora grovesii TaxID=303347 RepID=A0AAN6S753_9PEZI|nr:hypothetical protein QBC46DRAFT_405740 [Diplogelasinospora grovesii]